MLQMRYRNTPSPILVQPPERVNRGNKHLKKKLRFFRLSARNGSQGVESLCSSKGEDKLRYDLQQFIGRKSLSLFIYLIRPPYPSRPPVLQTSDAANIQGVASDSTAKLFGSTRYSRKRQISKAVAPFQHECKKGCKSSERNSNYYMTI